MIVNVSIVSIVKLEAVAGDAVRLLNNRQYEKMMSYYRREDRLRSLGASLLMRKAAHGEQVLYNEAGKPYIPERHFNISHSGDYVVIAEADTAVGVDIEKIGTVEGDWVKAALSPDEYKCMMEKASGDKTAAYWFYLLWTRKESLVKCEGHGFGKKYGIDSLSYDEYMLSVSLEEAIPEILLRDEAEVWRELLED